MIINGALAQQDISHLNNGEADALRVHSIETFGTHDGPGIRMVVFLQGCQFRCVYCANPDTMDVKGGKLIPIDDIVKRAVNQKPYFGKNGGVTVSGGEPLLQRSKLTLLFEKLHQEGINTALDSNGKLLNKEVEELLDETDLLLLDIKHIDDMLHHKLTGLGNEGVLKVARHREESKRPMWLRYVLVPGWTDQEEHLHRLGNHFKNYSNIKKVEILPYHKLGAHKWESLGMDYKLEGIETPNLELIEKAMHIFQMYFGDRVAVG